MEALLFQVGSFSIWWKIGKSGSCLGPHLGAVGTGAECFGGEWSREATEAAIQDFPGENCLSYYNPPSQTLGQVSEQQQNCHHEHVNVQFPQLH